MVYLQDQDFQDFIELYEREFGEHLTTTEAQVMATKLVHMIELITKPSTEDKTDSANH